MAHHEVMAIVITTPTGQIGSRVTRLVIQAGERPTLLVRNASKLSPEVRAASNVIEGDLSDKAFVLEATKGATALFWLIPTDYRSEDPVGDILKLGHNAAAAIKENKIEHTVLISSMGAEKRGGDFIGGLGQVEDLLLETGANVVFIRPGYFFSNLFGNLDTLKQGILPTTIPVDLEVPWNDPNDVGEVAAARLLNRSWSGQSVQYVAGPRSLTYNDVAQIISENAGKQVQAIRVGDDQLREGLTAAGFSKGAVEGFVGMGHRIGGGIESERSYVSTTPSTLDAWVYSNLRPALNG